ncbi:MAG: 6-phosphogluconolactonase [Bacteroidota bacterium]
MPKMHIYQDNQAVAAAFAAYLEEQIRGAKYFHMALSGGSTPKALFAHLAAAYADRIDWQKLHLYWGDERCVPPDDEQSNYRMTHEQLLQHVDIPTENIHRVRGEEEPAVEVQRYGHLIESRLPIVNGRPSFDLVILGMGADGHTASIFPHEMELLTAADHCAVATHPDSGQRRISLTGEVIRAARQIHFLVTGTSKSPVVKEIFHQTGAYESYPAYHIQKGEWWMDKGASGEL